MATHAERRVLPYRPDQMFDLVARVDRYPEFLPWCLGARIRSRQENVIVADLIIGFRGIRERFTSRVLLDRSQMRIDVAYLDGPFRYLNNHWIFNARPNDACEIDFFVDFEFRSRILQRIMGLLFNEAIRRMVSAFEARAADLYGHGSAEHDDAESVRPCNE
ncbi:MAG: type II toxin-antitoxin system RatA family toxin [Rhodospirillales bacterium]|nr:MAG: type II toxin-antitoxin system RatA family toxin [Rhodospirillales bacterium]